MPTSIAMVRSKMTVSNSVVNMMAALMREWWQMERMERHPLMLYDTIISTPARHGIGMAPTKPPKKSSTNSNTTV